MTPRKPPDTSEDEVQNEILQAVHEALNEAPAVIVATGDAPLAEIKLDSPLPLDAAGAEFADTRVELEIEIDRTEIYLKGPTAFTA